MDDAERGRGNPANSGCKNRAMDYNCDSTQDDDALSIRGQGGALPPPLGSVDGVGDGVGAVSVALTADVAVLALRTARTFEREHDPGEPQS